MKYVLASSSPRRKDLLSIFNLDLSLASHSFDEQKVEMNIGPKDYCEIISRGKASSLSESYDNMVIIAADTIVVVGNKILGKPNNESEAIEMLELLSDREHKVITGVNLLYRLKKINFSFSEETSVVFNKIDRNEIKYYVKKYKPLDKSGSYGIQDFSAIFVKSIKGCFFNVVGLPLFSLFYHLKRLELVQFPLNTDSRINKL